MFLKVENRKIICKSFVQICENCDVFAKSLADDWNFLFRFKKNIKFDNFRTSCDDFPSAKKI